MSIFLINNYKSEYSVLEKMASTEEDFTLDLENSELIDEISDEYLQGICENTPPAKLRQLLTALCVEVVMIECLEEYTKALLEFRNAVYSIRKTNPLITIEKGEVKDGQILVFQPQKIKTLEGLQFYFPYQKNLVEHIPPSKDELEDIYLAAQSENSDVRHAAEWLIWAYVDSAKLKNNHHCWKRLSDLIQTVNCYFKREKEALCIFGQSALRAKAINSLNQEFQTTMREKNPGVFSNPSDQTLHERQALIDEWKNGIKARTALFNKSLAILKQIRNKQKNRMEFTKSYLSIPLGDISLSFFSTYNIPINFLDYPKRVETSILTKATPQIESTSSTKKPLNDIDIKEKSPAKRSPSKPEPKNRKQTLEKAPSITESPAKESQKVIQENKSKKKDPDKSPSSSMDSLLKPLPYPYSRRVLDWFSDDIEHLKYPSYARLSSILIKKQIAYHSFSRQVDQYLLTCGFEFNHQNSTFKGEDRILCVAGMMIFNEEDVEHGLFVYALGEDGKIYHRFYTNQRFEEMISFANPSLRQAMEFPTIKQALEMEKEIRLINVQLKTSLEPLEDSIEYNPILKSISIIDKKNEVKIILFQSTK